MQRKIGTLGFTLLIIWFAFIQAGGAIQVSTLSIWATIPAGETFKGSLTITNYHEEEAKIVVKLCDWKRTENGENILLEPNSSQTSLIPYLELKPEEAKLKPGESKQFKYKITLPDDLTGSLWGALLALPYKKIKDEKESNEKGNEELPLNELTRYGFPVKLWVLESSSMAPDGELKALEVHNSGEKESSQVFELVFENTGNIPLRPEGRLNIFDSSEKKIASAKLDKFGILPGAKRVIHIPVPEKDLPKGELEAEAVLKFGKEKVVKQEVTFNNEE